MRRRITHLLCSLLFATALAGGLTAAEAQARPLLASAAKSEMTAREAAAQAKAQYGGKVLRVKKQGNTYKVRLLQKSGRVITVTIRG